MTRDCASQPILPSLSYPVFMVVPSQDSNSGSPLPEEGFEFSQFHSQDENGRVVFGFHGPDQSRMEARSLDGSVRGSYSYIDPYGHIVKMQYWDDGAGFHVAGNALPGGDSGPQYTPEVAAARKEHLKIYKQTLAAVQHMLHNSDENAYADSPHSDPSIGISQFEDFSQYHNGHEDNSLSEDDKDSVSLENPELITGWHVFQNNDREPIKRPGVDEVEGEVDLGEGIGPDEDIESFENEEHENDNSKIPVNYKQLLEENDRKKEYENNQHKHEQYIDNRDREEDEQNTETKDDENNTDIKDDENNTDIKDDENNNNGEDVENKHNEDNEEEKSDDEESDKANDSIENRDEDNAQENDEEESIEDDYDPEKSENRNTELKLEAYPIQQPEGVRIVMNKELRVPGDQVAYDANDYHRISPTGKRRGFFYHFQHIIPKPTEKIEEAVEQGMKSAAAIRLPPTGEQEQLSIPHYSNPNYFPYYQK